MLKPTLDHLMPLCSALESNINDGDHATIAEQSAELVVWLQALNTLFDVNPVNPHKAIQSLDESIKALQAVRKQVFSSVENAIASGENVEGFAVKPGGAVRSIPDYNAAVKLLTTEAGIEQSWLFENKPLGVPAIEKLLIAAKFKPAQREALLEKFVEVTEGKGKVVVL